MELHRADPRGDDLMFSARGRIILTSSTPPAGSVGTSQLAAQSVTLPKLSRAGGSSGQVITHQGAGSDPAWATPSSGAPAVESADMSGTGWATATPSGGALASWLTSPARLVLNCDPGAAGSCGVSLATLLPNRDYYDVAIRFRVLSGDNSDQTRLILACGQSDTNFVQAMFFSDGRVETGAVVEGVYTFWNLSSSLFDATARGDGESWVRCHRNPSAVAWHWGRGSALPTVWRPIYSSVEREVAGQWAQARAGLVASNGPYGGIFGVTLSGVDFDARIDNIAAGLPGAFGGA